MGQGLRTVHVPRSSVGVLLFWNTDDPKLHCYEHNNDNPITMKRVTAVKIDKACFVFVYYYAFPAYEPDKPAKVLPSEGYEDEPMNSENGLDGSMITDDLTELPQGPTCRCHRPHLLQALVTRQCPMRGPTWNIPGNERDPTAALWC